MCCGSIGKKGDAEDEVDCAAVDANDEIVVVVAVVVVGDESGENRLKG